MCHISFRWTNNEKLVVLSKYNLYFYSSTVTIVCSRNRFRERSHISFFCGWDPFPWSSATAIEHTQGVDISISVTSGSLLSLERSVDLPLCLIYQLITAFSPKLQTLHCLLKYHAEEWTSSLLHVFSVFGWFSELTYFRFCFLVICWSYLWTDISFSLSIGNKLYSCHHILYITFLWKPLCWCYLVNILNLLSSSSPAKLVYYKCTITVLKRCSHYHVLEQIKGRIAASVVVVGTTVERLTDTGDFALVHQIKGLFTTTICNQSPREIKRV